MERLKTLSNTNATYEVTPLTALPHSTHDTHCCGPYLAVPEVAGAVEGTVVGAEVEVVVPHVI